AAAPATGGRSFPLSSDRRLTPRHISIPRVSALAAGHLRDQIFYFLAVFAQHGQRFFGKTPDLRILAGFGLLLEFLYGLAMVLGHRRNVLAVELLAGHLRQFLDHFPVLRLEFVGRAYTLFGRDLHEFVIGLGMVF